MIKALESAHRSGAHGHHHAVAVPERFYEATANGNEFGMHGVLTYLVGFHGLESPGTNMECELAHRNATRCYGIEHLRGEMQSGGRGCHRSVHMRVDRLVVGLVGILGGTVEIRGDGDFAHSCDYFGKCDRRIVPAEFHNRCLPHFVEAFGCERDAAAADFERHCQHPLLPSLGVAHEAGP